MSFSAKDAKDAANRIIAERRAERLSRVAPAFTLQVARLKEIAEKGEWGLFFSVPLGTGQDFIWYFENLGYSVITAPQIKQTIRDHITYHVTWS